MAKTSNAQVEKATARLTGKPPARIVRLVDQRLELKAQREQIEKDLKEIDVQLLAAVEEQGEIECDAWKVMKVDGENATINRELLLQHGVKPTIIAKCTKRKEYSYVRVHVKGKKDEDGK